MKLLLLTRQPAVTLTLVLLAYAISAGCADSAGKDTSEINLDDNEALEIPLGVCTIQIPTSEFQPSVIRQVGCGDDPLWLDETVSAQFRQSGSDQWRDFESASIDSEWQTITAVPTSSDCAQMQGNAMYDIAVVFPSSKRDEKVRAFRIVDDSQDSSDSPDTDSTTVDTDSPTEVWIDSDRPPDTDSTTGDTDSPTDDGIDTEFDSQQWPDSETIADTAVDTGVVVDTTVDSDSFSDSFEDTNESDSGTQYDSDAETDISNPATDSEFSTDTVIIIIVDTDTGDTATSDTDTDSIADTGTDTATVMDTGTETDTSTGTSTDTSQILLIEAECAFGTDVGDCDGRFTGTHSDDTDPWGGGSAPDCFEECEMVGVMNPGVWFAIHDIDFTQYSLLTLSVAGRFTDGNIHLILDDEGNTAFATIETYTGRYDIFQLFEVSIEDISDLHTLYIVGGANTSNAGNGNVDWIELAAPNP